MIKVFKTNKNGNIELTKDELEKLLNEAFECGRAFYKCDSNCNCKCDNDKEENANEENLVENHIESTDFTESIVKKDPPVSDISKDQKTAETDFFSRLELLFQSAVNGEISIDEFINEVIR